MRGFFLIFQFILIDHNMIQMPDIIYIFLDGSVGGEFAAACCVEECFLSPAFFISVCCFYAFLCVCIGTEVCEDQVRLSVILLPDW